LGPHFGRSVPIGLDLARNSSRKPSSGESLRKELRSQDGGETYRRRKLLRRRLFATGRYFLIVQNSLIGTVPSIPRRCAYYVILVARGSPLSAQAAMSKGYIPPKSWAIRRSGGHAGGLPPPASPARRACRSGPWSRGPSGPRASAPWRDRLWHPGGPRRRSF
jgi:hypothetical protein